MKPENNIYHNNMCKTRYNDEKRETSEYKELEKFSNEFIKKTTDIMADYQWSKDPFHAWSRGFEYTYVYQQIKNHKNSGLKIADLGSGVTFFPFFLTEKGYNVDAFDVNATFLKKYDQISKRLGMKIKFHPKSMDYIEAKNLYDIVFSISVIEHVPIAMYADISNNVYNMLNEKGKFIYTLDLYKNKGQKSIESFTNHLNKLFGSSLKLSEIYYDSADNLTPEYVVNKWGCADRFPRTLKTILYSLYKRKFPYKYPKININYGYVTKS